MAKFNSVFLLLFLVAFYAGGVSFLATLRGTGLLNFWSGVVGAMAPWIVATLAVILSATLVPKTLQQAAGMAGLFPMLATCGVALVSPLVSLILQPSTPWAWRLKWFGLISSIPAVIMTAFLIAIFIKDSRIP